MWEWLFDDPFLLHCSQTAGRRSRQGSRFDDPFLLHCSQTLCCPIHDSCQFDDPFLLHCSQTPDLCFRDEKSLMILFFYTALKLDFNSDEPTVGLMILFFYTALKQID